jgi:23S rRNA (pseudouridine1915-N3)-methyltransferase
MKIRLLSVGTRQPAWVKEGYETYARRLPRESALVLEEIPAAPRRGGDSARWIAEEGAALLARVQRDDCVIALDERGRQLASAALAQELAHWRSDGRDVVLLIGGADGLAAPCLARAQWQWALTSATLPHGLVRILVAEQIYRAWTLLSGHPYHRA